MRHLIDLPHGAASGRVVPSRALSTTRHRRRSLSAACAAHAVHDGFTDLIYVLLPIWQAQFGLSYAMTGMLRGLYAGVTALLQIPAAHLAERLGSRKMVLVIGTALAGLGYLVAGQAGGLVGIGAALALGGVGASSQHPLAAALVAKSHQGADSRQALATYNFFGDVGKMLFPALVALSLGWLAWQQTLTLIGCLGILTALVLAWLIPSAPPDLAVGGRVSAVIAPSEGGERLSPGFVALWFSGLIDSAARMGFLTYLPFVLTAKGADMLTVGTALSMLFLGGAFGKFACGRLGARLGMMRTVWLTEISTALCIIAILALPLTATLLVLPMLGAVLNGTSSVFYGTVPELVATERQERAFALFYTGTIGGGAASPLLFGWIGDQIGISSAVQCIAAVVLITVPLAWVVDRALQRSPPCAP